jgi:hypothetical protein
MAKRPDVPGQIESLRFVDMILLRFSAIWALVGFGAVFTITMIHFSKGDLTLSPVFNGMAVGLGAALLGLGHSRYQYYLLELDPGRYAGLYKRIKGGQGLFGGPVKGGLSIPPHPFRKIVAFSYIMGVLTFVLVIVLLWSQLSVVSALSYGIGGFYLARVVFWKKALALYQGQGIHWEES